VILEYFTEIEAKITRLFESHWAGNSTTLRLLLIVLAPERIRVEVSFYKSVVRFTKNRTESF
jgi:ABC-type Na+ transport system ATPase subunit NatA